MLRSTMLLALVGLASAEHELLGKKVARSPQPVHVPRWGVFSFQARDIPCNGGLVNCDAGCIPSSGACCHSGNLDYCDRGYHCYEGGCCPDGQFCSGPVTGCAGRETLCGQECCNTDQTCSPNFACEDPRGGGDGGLRGGGGGSRSESEPAQPTPTPTPSASESDASTPTPTPSASDPGSSTPTPTDSSSGGDSSTDSSPGSTAASTTPTMTSGDSSSTTQSSPSQSPTSSGKKGGAGALHAPHAALALLAFAPLVL